MSHTRTLSTCCAPAFPLRSKKSERGVEDAKQSALKLLGARAHSRKELKVKPQG